MKYACYLRVSTKEQSIEMQRLDIHKYLEQNNISLSDVVFYEDQLSGKHDNRKALQQMLADVRSGSIRTVIIWKLDRLFRSLKHLINIIQEFEDMGVVLISIKDHIDLSTPSGRLLVHMIGAFAEFERAIIIERVQAGMRNAQANGTKSGKPIGRAPKLFNINDALKLRNSGSSIREIASKMKVSKSVIGRAL